MDRAEVMAGVMPEWRLTRDLTHIYEMQAASKQVILDTLELEVEGTLTPRPGSTGTPPRYADIRYSV